MSQPMTGRERELAAAGAFLDGLAEGAAALVFEGEARPSSLLELRYVVLEDADAAPIW